MNRRLLLVPVLVVGVGLLPACDRSATSSGYAGGSGDTGNTGTVTVTAPGGGDEATLDRVDTLLDSIERQVDTGTG